MLIHACQQAVEQLHRAIGFGNYIVSATTPFTRDDLTELREDAPAVVRRYGQAGSAFGGRGKKLVKRFASARSPSTFSAPSISSLPSGTPP